MRFCTLIIMGISALAIFPKRSAAQERLSLEEAMTMLYSQSKTIRIAEKGLDIGDDLKQMLNSAWYPYINAAGAYINLSEEIKVQESVANLAKPIAEQLQQKEKEVQELRAQLRDLHEQNKQDFEAILTDKQLKKLKQIKTEHKQKFDKHKKHKGHKRPHPCHKPIPIKK